MDYSNFCLECVPLMICPFTDNWTVIQIHSVNQF